MGGVHRLLKIPGEVPERLPHWYVPQAICVSHENAGQLSYELKAVARPSLEPRPSMQLFFSQLWKKMFSTVAKNNCVEGLGSRLAKAHLHLTSAASEKNIMTI